jgi:hypothetical protein
MITRNAWDKDEPRDSLVLVHSLGHEMDILVRSEIRSHQKRELLFIEESVALLGALIGTIFALEHENIVDHELVLPAKLDIEDSPPENVIARWVSQTQKMNGCLPNNILDVLRLVVEGFPIDKHGSFGAIDVKESQQVAFGDEILKNKMPVCFQEIEVLIRIDECIAKTIQIAIIVDKLDDGLPIFRIGHRLPCCCHFCLYNRMNMYLSQSFPSNENSRS